MKRNTKLLILIGVLVICVAGYGLISAFTKEEPVEEEKTISITDFNANDVAVLRWEYQGQKFELSKTDDVWYNEADKDFPVAQSYTSTMSTQIASMAASRKLTDVTDLGEYGLDEPGLSVSIMTSTGGELSFVFGDVNSVTGEYYMQYSEGSNVTASKDVYLVPESVVTAFSYTMDQLVQFETLPSLSDVNSIKIDANESYRLNYMGDDVPIPWVLRDNAGNKNSANTELCQQLQTALQNLAFKRCVSYNTLKEDLSQYGLDHPWATVKVDYNIPATSSSEEKSDEIVFQFGDVTENGEYYVMVEGFRMLYTLDSSVVDWIKANNIAGLIDISSMS